MKAEPLPPGSTIGILGGGQLGRMLALAAARHGLRCHVYSPQAEGPAAQVCHEVTAAPYEDEAALARFAEAVDVVTYEFENVPAATASFLETRVPVRPSPTALAVCQDRVVEKRFLRDADATTAGFRAIDTLDDLRAAIGDLGVPAVLKSRRFGYDGKGQAAIRTAEGAAAAWEAVGGVPAILEAFVPFDCELSVVVARGTSGAIACYDLARNVHEHHILARSVVPAGVAPETAAYAEALAGRIVERLDYVGVMGVELFLEGGVRDRVYVNELAPRVHNSGHWTLDACTVSQFEQHVRAVCGWPLGDPARHHDAVMENLLGDEVERWREIAEEPATALHIYGKQGTAPGRKMGHLTRLYPLGTGPRPS